MKTNRKSSEKLSLRNVGLQVIMMYPILLILFLVALTGSAQMVSLEQVLQTIDKQNPMLQEYDNKAKAMEAYTQGSRSWMAPMVGVGTFMTPYPGQNIMEDRDKGSFMISAEQNIPNLAKLNATQKYAASRAQVETATRAVQYNYLRSEAKSAYYTWLVAEKRLTVLNESEQIINWMIKVAKARYPYNQGSLGDIYKAEARLAEVENMKLMTRGEIEDSESRMKALMNLPLSTSIQIDTNTVVEFKEEQVLLDTMNLRTDRSDLKRIDQLIVSMQLNQQLQQSKAKPDFRIRFDHMQSFGNMPTQFTAMAMISIPIAPWSSGMYRSEVAGMSYEIEAMKRGQEGIVSEARGMIVGMASQLKRMKQQLANYEMKVLPALKKNYEVTRLAYEENQEQLPMVIDAWEAWNMGELAFLEKKEEYYLMIVRYEREIEK